MKRPKPRSSNENEEEEEGVEEVLVIIDVEYDSTDSVTEILSSSFVTPKSERSFGDVVVVDKRRVRQSHKASRKL